MLCAGDELGHTQGGNNNPYCQDNAITWIDWVSADADLMAFTERVLSLRRTILPFRNQWYSGDTDAQGVADLNWLQRDGRALVGSDWNDTNECILGCYIGHPGRTTSPVMLIFNPGATAEDFVLPGGHWQALLDTSHPTGATSWVVSGGLPLTVPAHSLVLLLTFTPMQAA
jgi:glycogen operon protein